MKLQIEKSEQLITGQDSEQQLSEESIAEGRVSRAREKIISQCAGLKIVKPAARKEKVRQGV